MIHLTLLIIQNFKKIANTQKWGEIGDLKLRKTNTNDDTIYNSKIELEIGRAPAVE